MDQAPKFTAGQIAMACSGSLVVGDWNAGADVIGTDSRTAAPGQAFVALVGEKHDAHAFVPVALEAGAAIVVVQRTDAAWRVGAGTAVVQVADTTRALLDLAAWHRARLRGAVIAVTGSCGKSTVKTILAALLATRGRCTAAQKSFNNRIGVSLTLLGAEVDDGFVVLEMGTNHFGEIEELASCARPDAGIITCIGESHLQALGDRQGVLSAKAELIPHIAREGLLVLNADDPLCMSLARRFGGRVITFGTDDKADVQAMHVRREAGGMVFRLGLHGAEPAPFRLPFTGQHNVMNAAAALAAATWAGVGLDDARRALAQVGLPALRQQVRQIHGITFVMDCYNSNPTAMRAALRAFLDEPTGGRRVVVCGDMLELGPKAPEMHVRLGRVLGLTQVDTLVAVGPLGVYLLEGWNSLARDAQKALHFLSPDQAWRPLWDCLSPGDIVLVKGSRAMELEKIVEHIARHVAELKKSAA